VGAPKPARAKDRAKDKGKPALAPAE
jgi:hypothetical protein